MKTFIIGDLHNHIDWVEPWLESHPHDKVIFLGDYFDNFHDTKKIARKTAKWLANSVSKENRVHLMGNHDMPYRFPWNYYFDCPGWTPEKQQVITSEFENISKLSGYNPWTKIKLAHFDHENKIIYSHAGLSGKLFKVCPINGPNLKNYETQLTLDLEECYTKGNKRIDSVQQNLDYTYNGITWVRWWHIKLLPGVTQVVGHTPTAIILKLPFNEATPIWKSEDGGDIWNLDCSHNWVGVLEDGEFYCIHRDDDRIITKENFGG